MNIIAHRGYWLSPSEKNSQIAFRRALESGFGIEIDIRDSNGELVISHDMPAIGAMKLDEFVRLYVEFPVAVPIALNVKADGLYSPLSQSISRAGFNSAFVFDMSVPDIRGYLAEQIPIFTRLSEQEPYPAFFEESQGVWLDAFESEWYDATVIQELLKKNKQVAIVSPELHHRPYLELWDFLRKNNFHQNSQISLCTDFPQTAKEYFNV